MTSRKEGKVVFSNQINEAWVKECERGGERGSPENPHINGTVDSR